MNEEAGCALPLGKTLNEGAVLERYTPNAEPRPRLRVAPFPSRLPLVSHLDISRPHSLGLVGARRAADDVADRLRQDFGATATWEGDHLLVTARGVSGRIEINESLVRVTARLGLAARPFRNLLRREVEQQLDRSLSQPA